ncbi:MAG: TonB-dependent receptor [Bacteroidota bacterium]
MLRKTLITCLLTGMFQYVFAQAVVTGTIKDDENNEALPGATVLLKGSGLGSLTDLNGKFTITNVAAGDYTLKVTYIGFGTLEKQVTVGSQTLDLGEIKLKEEAIGLNEVEVFASVVQERKTPIAISSISAQALDERYNNVSIAEAIQNTPGVYTIQGAGGYGDQEVYIRGFDQTNVAFLVNGIPVNDMENGRMFWSNFAGLNQVTRTLQVQRGLGASNLAVSSIGGTVNMITKPADRSEGGRLEYQFGTGSWNNRLRFTYNTGESANGWAFSFQGARTTTSNGFVGLSDNNQGSIVPGAYTDAWSYYLAASKKINERHQVMFWAFGAPFDRGSAFVVDDQTREIFGIEDPIANNALGIYRGEIFNARQNKVHKPLTALTHYWDIDRNTNLSTSLYYSNAQVYSVQPRDAQEAVFFADRSDPALIGTAITSDNLINWDFLATQNRDESRLMTVNFPNGNPNVESVSGFNSRYYLESRHNNHNWIGLVSNFTKQIGDLKIRSGIDMRRYRGEHFAEVFDLMDGDFIVQQNRFGDPYNKLDSENAIAEEGDKTNYWYDGIVNWYSFFGQAEYTIDKLDLFGSATVTFSDMQRVGYFWNGSAFSNFNVSSLGKSEKRNFTTYTLKAGVNYRITGRHNVFFNGGFITRPPFLINAFNDARFSNQYRTGLTEEKVRSVEAGYGFKTSFLKANLNVYYLQWRDRTTGVNGQPEDLSGDEDFFINPPSFSANGLVSEHKGIELDFVWNIFSSLELNGFVGLGDWVWKEAPSQSFEINERTFTLDNTSEIEGLRVGAAAQTTAGFGLHYRGIRSTYFGGRFNYADRIPIRYNPEDIADGFIDREVIEQGFPDYYTVDLYAGRYFDFGDNLSGRISVNVQNVLNEEYTRWAAYFFNQTQRAFGFPRTYTIGLSIDF